MLHVALPAPLARPIAASPAAMGVDAFPAHAPCPRARRGPANGPRSSHTHSRLHRTPRARHNACIGPKHAQLRGSGWPRTCRDSAPAATPDPADTHSIRSRPCAAPRVADPPWARAGAPTMRARQHSPPRRPASLQMSRPDAPATSTWHRRGREPRNVTRQARPWVAGAAWLARQVANPSLLLGPYDATVSRRCHSAFLCRFFWQIRHVAHQSPSR